MKRTETPILVSALRTLALDIDSPDGVANAAIAEGADRIEELQAELDNYRSSIQRLTRDVQIAFSSPVEDDPTAWTPVWEALPDPGQRVEVLNMKGERP